MRLRSKLTASAIMLCGAMVIVLSLAPSRDKRYGVTIRDAIGEQVRAPAPAPLQIIKFTPSTQPDNRITLRVGSSTFYLPRTTRKIAVAGHSAADSLEAPRVRVRIRNTTGAMSRFFKGSTELSDNDGAAAPADSIEIGWLAERWVIPAHGVNEIDVEWAGAGPCGLLSASPLWDDGDSIFFVGNKELYRLVAEEIATGAVTKGLVKAGEPPERAAKLCTDALRRLDSESPEEFLRRVLQTSESQLVGAATAADATEQGLVFGTRWLQPPLYEAVRTDVADGHLYVLCSQASRGALYKIEAFGGTGAVKWTGQLTLYANARLKSRALRMNYIYSLTSK